MSLASTLSTEFSVLFHFVSLATATTGYFSHRCLVLGLAVWFGSLFCVFPQETQRRRLSRGLALYPNNRRNANFYFWTVLLHVLWNGRYMNIQFVTDHQCYVCKENRLILPYTLALCTCFALTLYILSILKCSYRISISIKNNCGNI